MKFSYEDLLSGDPIFVEGKVHFRSPVLKELKPGGIGITLYNIYLAILSMDKDNFLKHIPESHAVILSKNAQLTAYDMMTVLKPDFR